MKTISVKIGDSLNHWLEGEARKLGRTKSDLTREALDQRRRNGALDSIHERMKNLCGIIKGAPKDFASNPKYLKGFGR